jgi:hypothetical protein
VLSPAQRQARAWWAWGRWAKNGLPLRLVLAAPWPPQQAIRILPGAVRLARFSSDHCSPVKSQTWISRSSTCARNGMATSPGAAATLADPPSS